MAGIDYGMGKTNVDMATGIRYGVISQNMVCQAWADNSEPDYGAPTCPKCGSEVLLDTAWPEDYEHYGEGGCADYACVDCCMTFDSADVYGDEPGGWNYSGDGYECVDCLDSDIMILKSAFYTFADFCSPCVPGAGNLQSYNGDGVRTYCFGHDWFEEGKAPYPVFRVDTHEEVEVSANKEIAGV